jgi:hypothetical protein
MSTKVAVESMADGYRLVQRGELFERGDERTGRFADDPPWVPLSPHMIGEACKGLYGLVRRKLVPKSPRKAPKLQETSIRAHESQKDKAPLDRVRLSDRIRKYPTGITCDRLEGLLGMKHQTASARLRDLAIAGKIVDSGRRETTSTGRKAICWKVVS